VKISTRGEYGIRAMLYLALKADEGPVTSHEIAVEQAIPEPYLRQILAALSKDGLIQSNRGPQGGHALGRDAEEISLHDVLLTLEGHTTSIDQILALPCSIGLGTERCAIREVFLRVKDAVDGILATTTLAELAGRQKQILDRGISVPHDVDAAPGLLPIVSE
jgi:Rrf2 family protein